MKTEITLLDVVLDYITLYGLTEMARQHFLDQQKGRSSPELSPLLKDASELSLGAVSSQPPEL